MEQLNLGGRAFVPIDESTVAHNLHFTALVKRAGLDKLTIESDEAPDLFARRILDACLVNSVVLELLGCLMVPEDLVADGRAPYEVWNPKVAKDTAAYLGGLHGNDANAQVENLVVELLMNFFVSGVSSLWSTATPSRETTPPADALSPGIPIAGVSGQA